MSPALDWCFSLLRDAAGEAVLLLLFAQLVIAWNALARALQALYNRLRAAVYGFLFPPTLAFA